MLAIVWGTQYCVFDGKAVFGELFFDDVYFGQPVRSGSESCRGILTLFMTLAILPPVYMSTRLVNT